MKRSTAAVRFSEMNSPCGREKELRRILVVTKSNDNAQLERN